MPQQESGAALAIALIFLGGAKTRQRAAGRGLVESRAHWDPGQTSRGCAASHEMHANGIRAITSSAWINPPATWNTTQPKIQQTRNTTKSEEQGDLQ
jgi:hypothetical protein